MPRKTKKKDLNGDDILAKSNHIGLMEAAPELFPEFAATQSTPPFLVRMPDGTMRRPEDANKPLSEIKSKLRRLDF